MLHLVNDVHHIDADNGYTFIPFKEPPSKYDQAYFDKYVAYGKTTLGIALNSLRVGLVAKYMNVWEPLLDIGIGDGAFIRARDQESWGYDINPAGVDLLKDTGRWLDPYANDTRIHAVSFWDALEHIEEPQQIINKVDSYCFVSIPIFYDDIPFVNSKHYRPDEHCWYFTLSGLVAWFWNLGFVCKEINGMETMVGREDIGTFVFERKR